MAERPAPTGPPGPQRSGTPNSQRRRRTGGEDVEHYVARRVRDLRQARALTQEDLAAALGVKRESVSRYESGDRAIGVGLLLDIAAALGQPLAAFLPPQRTPDEPLAAIVSALRARPDLISQVQELLAANDRPPGPTTHDHGEV